MKLNADNLTGFDLLKAVFLKSGDRTWVQAVFPANIWIFKFVFLIVLGIKLILDWTHRYMLVGNSLNKCPDSKSVEKLPLTKKDDNVIILIVIFMKK